MENLVDYIKRADDALYGGSIKKSLVKEIEKQLNLTFSDEYKTYLYEFGITAILGHELTGISDSNNTNVKDVTEEEWQYNNLVSHSLYVVEKTGIDGIVIWQNQKGEIYQTFQGTSPVKIYNSLYEFIVKN
ncbi:SMI1/KNR4 family protein [Streptococcus pluranimalium]